MEREVAEGERSPPVEMDVDFRSTARVSSFRPSPDGARCRRMLFNPWLGLSAMIGWVRVLAFVFEVGEGVWGISLILSSLPLAILAPRLFHFHCLDCGATGRAGRWRLHLCPRVARRIVEGRTARARPPGRMVQYLIWLWVLGLIGVLLQLG